MEDYLRHTKTALTDLSRFQKIHGILGNESCDLDSAVSSLTYGYHLNSVHSNEENVLFLPILDIPRAEFRLRTETTHLLSKVKIPFDLLTFCDEVDLHALHTEGKLVLTLVDQNVLPSKDAILEDAVVMVIDHHHKERPDSDRTEIILDLVGSCCTLIAEQLLQHPFFTMDDQTATLLYGTILTDTVNRSPEVGKTTPRDDDILKELSRKLPDVNGQELFDEIQAAKCNISGLTNHEILLRDLKKIGNTNMSIAMSTVTMQLQTLLERERFLEDLKSFCESQGAEVSVLMTLSGTGSAIERQIAVYSEKRIFRQQIADLLDNSTDPSFQLEPLSSSTESLVCFSQGNVKASRKKVLPILKSFLTGEETPGVDTSGFPFEGLESETIGSDVPLTNIKDSFNQESLEEFPQNSDADPFGLFSGGGEANAENGFSSTNPFDPFSDFLQGSNSAPGDSETQQQAGSEFDPFSLAGSEVLSEPKSAADSFIDNLLSGDTAGSAGITEPQFSKDVLSPKFDLSSGQESPLELSSELTSAGSSYPVTPPNSYMDSDMERYAKELNLPSFNSSEMVKIIKEKQASLDQDPIPEEGSEENTFPFTPRNSYQQSPMENFDRHPELPSFQGEEMYQRIMDKRASLGGELDGTYYGPGVQFDSSAEDGLNRNISEEHSAPSTDSDNAGALGLTQDLKGADTFGVISESNTENVVAQSIAEQMKDSDPFSLGITQMESSSQDQGSSGIIGDDPFSLGLMSDANTNAKLAEDITDSDPFSFGLTDNAASLEASSENVVASSIAEKLKTANPFYQEASDILQDSEADMAEADQSERVVREPSVENFQDFLPEVERNVISPSSPTKHEETPSDKATSQISSNLEEIFGYSNLDAEMKENLYNYNTEDMSEAIIRQNLEETQSKCTDQMAGIILPGALSQSEENKDGEPEQVVESEEDKSYAVAGLDNPAFAASIDLEDQIEFSEDNVASRIAEEMKSARNDDFYSSDSVSSDSVVAAKIAEEMKSGRNDDFYSGDSVSSDNVVAARIAEEMKSARNDDPFSGDFVSSDNVVAARIAEEMKSARNDDFYSGDSVSSDNVVAARIAEEIKSDHFSEEGNEEVDESVYRDVVAASLANEMKSDRIESDNISRSDNVVAGLIANEMKSDMFTEDNESKPTPEKKKRKGVVFADAVNSSTESDGFEDQSGADNPADQNFETNEAETSEFAVAQKFAEEIISEACEIVAKDENPPKASMPKGLSRSEMARRMMEEDDFDSESSQSEKDPSVDNLQQLAEGVYGSNEEAEDETPESEQRDMPTYEHSAEKFQHDDQGHDKIGIDPSGEAEDIPKQEEDLQKEPAEVLQLGISAREEEPEDAQHDMEYPEEGESDLTVAQRITDTVVSEAMEHLSTEQDAVIAQKLAEAMEESEGEADHSEADHGEAEQGEAIQEQANAKDQKRTRFEDESSDGEVEADTTEQVKLETENEEPIEKEWDNMPEFQTGINGDGDHSNNGNSVKPKQMVSDLSDLSPNSEEAVREIAFDMASDIIQKALDTFPAEELHVPAESDESFSSPPSSDISPNSENYPQSSELHTEMKRSHEMCPITAKDEAARQDLEATADMREGFELPLETEYLPNVDPLHGSLDLVTSPVRLLETDANKDVAENTSFKQLSTEMYSSQSESESEESVIEDLTVSKEPLNPPAEKESVISSQEVNQANETSIAEELTDARAKIDEPTSETVQSVAENFRTQHATSLEASQFARKVETLASRDDDETVAPPAGLDSKHKKEIYMTTAGRISISTDYPTESDEDINGHRAVKADTIAEESRQQVGEILARTESVVGQADAKLACSSVDLTSDVAQKDDVTDEEFLSKTKVALAEAMADTDDSEVKEVQIDIGSRVIPIETEVRLRQDSESSDTVSKSARPETLPISSANQPKRKIHPNIDLMAGETSDSDVDIDDDTSLSSGASDLLQGVDDLKTPDIATPDALGMAPELEWENDTPVASPAAEAIPEYSAEEESQDQKNWRTVTIGDQEYTIDMKVVEPYKRVLSHGGYYGEGLSAMIVFSGCYLPDRSRKDYSYVMENLFFYIISTLELLVADDYMIVYFHGATPRKQMPSFGWLKRCYQMIDRRLKKNLKGLLLVHPTLWIKTVVMMSRPFISSKFSSKLKMVRTLADLEKLVPMEYVYVPDQVRQYDERRQKSSSVSTPSTPSSAAVSPR